LLLFVFFIKKTQKKMSANTEEVLMLDSAAAVGEIQRAAPAQAASEISLVARDQQRAMAYVQFRQFLDLAWEQIEADADKIGVTLPGAPPARPRRS
jgi:hypothetical protein